jgi:DNA-binding transcriptional MerR regulator
MLIGEVSRAAGVSVRSIRYYEQKGLISAGRRSNGYRDYDESVPEQIKMIKLCLGLGISIDETAKILKCPVSGQERLPYCQEALASYESRLKELDRQLEMMARIRAGLLDILAEGKRGEQE